MKRFEDDNCLANWKKLDELLDRMDWKDSRKITVVIPPVVISSEMRNTEDNLIVGESISPIQGTLSKIVVRADFGNKPPGLVKIEVEGLTQNISNIIEMNGNIQSIPLSVAVGEGAIIRVSSLSPTTLITRLGFSCLIELDRGLAKTMPMDYPLLEG